MRFARIVLAAAAAGAVAAGNAAAATPAGHSIVIRHQLRGCHSWAVDGGAFKPTQALSLTRGASITVTNNDVMPHRLVESSGPARLQIVPALLGHMGAKVKVTFSKPGVYRFTTKAGEDYFKGVKTIGADNVLHLTVTVG